MSFEDSAKMAGVSEPRQARHFRKFCRRVLKQHRRCADSMRLDECSWRDTGHAPEVVLKVFHAVFLSTSAMFAQAESFIAMLNGKEGSLSPVAEALESIVIAQEWALQLTSK